jgi:hypothetical protein
MTVALQPPADARYRHGSSLRAGPVVRLAP